MSNLVSIILVAILGVFGNIVYFEYQTNKKKSKDILKQKLTDLLLPLYVILHLKEVSMDAWLSSGEGDYAEAHSDLPTRVLPLIEKIIEENIYLANDSLHEACLDFLQWAYSSNERERFQEIKRGSFDSSIRDKDFRKFYDIVVYEYNNARHQYIK